MVYETCLACICLSPPNSAVILVYNQVTSHLDYCSSLLFGLSVKSIHKIHHQNHRLPVS